MRRNNVGIVHLALWGLLVSLGNPAYSAEDKALTEMLPACVNPPLGIGVLGGDTLSGIARRMAKPSAISNNEWVNLIYQRNRDTFIEGNRNLIPESAVLLFPCSNIQQIHGEQPNLLGDPAVNDLAPAVQDMGTEIAEIKQLVESQTTIIKQLVGDQAKGVNVQPEPSGFFTLAMLGLTSLISVLLIILSIYLYRWRRSLSSVVGLTLPQLTNIEQILPGLGAKIEKAESRILQRIRHSGGEQEDSDQPDLRDYLKRLIPVDIAIDDFMKDDGSKSESLKVVKALVEDALDSCGVTTFAPEIGEDYRRAEGVADYPKTRVTDKPEDKFKIVEVLENGYRLGDDIIYPARVRIFTTN